LKPAQVVLAASLLSFAGSGAYAAAQKLGLDPATLQEFINVAGDLFQRVGIQPSGSTRLSEISSITAASMPTSA